MSEAVTGLTHTFLNGMNSLGALLRALPSAPRRPPKASAPARRGAPPSRRQFRTIQISLNDLPATLWQAERAAKPTARLRHVRHQTTRVHHAAQRRGRMAACGARAAAGDAGGGIYERPVS